MGTLVFDLIAPHPRLLWTSLSVNIGTNSASYSIWSVRSIAMNRMGEKTRKQAYVQIIYNVIHRCSSRDIWTVYSGGINTHVDFHLRYVGRVSYRKWQLNCIVKEHVGKIRRRRPCRQRKPVYKGTWVWKVLEGSGRHWDLGCDGLSGGL